MARRNYQYPFIFGDQDKLDYEIPSYGFGKPKLKEGFSFDKGYQNQKAAGSIPWTERIGGAPRSGGRVVKGATPYYEIVAKPAPKPAPAPAAAPAPKPKPAVIDNPYRSQTEALLKQIDAQTKQFTTAQATQQKQFNDLLTSQQAQYTNKLNAQQKAFDTQSAGFLKGIGLLGEQMKADRSAYNAQLAGITDTLTALKNKKPTTSFAGSSFVNPGPTNFAAAGKLPIKGGTQAFKRQKSSVNAKPKTIQSLNV